MLQVKNVKKSFRSGDGMVAAVNNVSLQVNNGQFASIIGQSGSGKSTLLSLLGALDKPTSGSIVVDDQDVATMGDHALIRYRCQRIGFVFQNYNLVPNLTPKKQRIERAKELLAQVGLTENEMRRKPARLSGGQQQRVAIARALANKPSLILADEPTGNLDSKTGKMIFDLLHGLARSENTTVIAVTHDLSIAGKSDVTFRLQDGTLVKK
jgi:putative ABC transport system ATP-binding protein